MRRSIICAVLTLATSGCATSRRDKARVEPIIGGRNSGEGSGNLVYVPVAQASAIAPSVTTAPLAPGASVAVPAAPYPAPLAASGAPPAPTPSATALPPPIVASVPSQGAPIAMAPAFNPYGATVAPTPMVPTPLSTPMVPLAPMVRPGGLALPPFSGPTTGSSFSPAGVAVPIGVPSMSGASPAIGATAGPPMTAGLNPPGQLRLHPVPGPAAIPGPVAASGFLNEGDVVGLKNHPKPPSVIAVEHTTPAPRQNRSTPGVREPLVAPPPPAIDRSRESRPPTATTDQPEKTQDDNGFLPMPPPPVIPP